VCTLRSIEGIPLLGEKATCIHQSHLLLISSRGEQNTLAGDTLPHGEHGFEDSLVRIVCNTAYLPCRSHIHSEYRVGFLQTGKGELRSLNPYVVKIECILIGFLYRQAEHDACGKIYEVYLQHLADKGETSRSS